MKDESRTKIPGFKGDQWIEGEVKFKADDISYHFKIIHNLPDTPRMSFIDAVNSWLLRYEELTDTDLVRYINSKREMTGNSAMTYRVYNLHMATVVSLKAKGINPSSNEG
jgi:hypothetical protein